MSESSKVGLPRLLYLGDVPVEASYHGSTLLYRLLQTYPADRLTIFEAGVVVSEPKRRLPNVTYRALPWPLARLQTTRFASWYTAACLRNAGLRAGSLQGLVRACRPEAILSVTHGNSWITAAELARRLNLPLHLICHDEWARAGAMQAWKDRVFGECYRQASSRLCVSPFMAREYARRYDADALVLYPSRAVDAVRYDEPPPRLGGGAASFTCVFAGTINSSGVVIALQKVARCLEPLGGRLLLYGPLTADVARASGLAAPNMELGGMLSSASLIETLREHADALFVPMSFSVMDQSNMAIGFPSKLTDYTSAGLPLLIYGPPYSAAVRWAADNKGVAEVVTEESEGVLSAAVRRLARDPQHRMRLARKALTAGEAYFSHRAAAAVFYKGLAGTRSETDGRCDGQLSSKQTLASA